MKKYLCLFFVALFATMSFALSSCSDDEPQNGNELLGTWKSVGGMSAELNNTQYLQFNSNGTYAEVNIDENNGETDVLKGKWERNGNNVRVYGGDVIGITVTIIKLTSSQLTLNSLWEQDYKKVEDSDIQKYL